MSFAESIQTCFNKYFDFSGRAPRSEYWWFALLGLGLSFIPVIGWILRLAILLPSLSVQVRRLHDMERSAWWLLLLVPPITIIGVFILLIMSIFPGTAGPNRYGPDPLGARYGIGGFDYPPPGSTYSPPPTDWYSGEGPSPTVEGSGSVLDDPPESVPDPGTESGQTRYCTQCGTRIQTDARFCTFCGRTV